MDLEPDKRFISIAFISIIFIIISCKQTTTSDQEKDISKKKKTDSLSKINQFIDPDATGKRTIYLTFDDGPNKGTPTVVSILNEEQVPATFFIIGMHVKEMPVSKTIMPILKSMSNFVLCNHSYTHAYKNQFEKFYTDLSGSVNDFQRCRDTVNFSNPLARTPGNNIWRTPHFNQTTYERYKPAANNLYDSGFVLFGWDIEWRYRGMKLKQTVDQMEKEIDNMYLHKENRYKNHCVLLMHDITFLDAHDSTQLRELIHRLKTNPIYRFDIATNHPFVKQ